MLLDVLPRQFEVYTFFLTYSAAEFHCTKIIEVVTFQFGEILTDKQTNTMDWSTKVAYLKRNPIIVVRQIDYVFKELWGKVILSKMHPIVHVPIHIVDTPKPDENEESEVVEFIDKYIICALLDEPKYPEMNNLIIESADLPSNNHL